MRTPNVHQMQGNECGLAALAIVLGYFGRHVTLAELRTASGISREGITAARLLQLAREYGLEAKGFRKEIAQLREIALPAIAVFRFNHFVVVEEVHDDRIVVNDPDGGPHAVRLEFLVEDYVGVVMTFRPGPSFIKKGTPFSAIRALRKLVGSWPVPASILALASMAEWVGPLLISTGVFALTAGDLSSAVRWLVLGAIISAVIAGISSVADARLHMALAVTEAERMLSRARRFPSAFYVYRYVATTCSTVTIWPAIAGFTSNSLAAWFGAAPIPIAIVWEAVRSPGVALLTVACCALTFVGWWTLYRPRDGVYRATMHEGYGDAGLEVGEISELERLKLGAGVAGAFSRIAGKQAILVSARQPVDLAVRFRNVLKTAMILLPALYALVFPTPANAAAAVLSVYCVTRFERAAVWGLRIDGLEALLMRIEDTPADIDRRQEAADSATGVTLKNVSFGYDTRRDPILSGIHLEIAPGRVVGLAGRPGSARSTLARLVCGTLTAWSGRIHAPGAELVESWNAIFEGTVIDNLALFDPLIGESDVVEALRIACAEEFIERRGGVQARVASAGANFSGGELQRLAIARALVRHPNLLILDEATDALDPDLEARLIANVRALGLTCILISLRPSTLALCDEIVVLADGSIAERGSPSELRQTRGAFASLMHA